MMCRLSQFIAVQATPRHLRNRATILLVCIIISAAHAAPIPGGFSAGIALEFGGQGSATLAMPTAVAVDGAGNVWVCDGTNDRVVQFDAAGKLINEIRQAGDISLLRPLSVRYDQGGRLWITDTGNRRVLVRQSDGRSFDVIMMPPLDDRPIDPTDVLPEPDGRRIWIVDNDGHRLIRMEIHQPAVPPLVVGGKGESLGQFLYPFMIARSRQEDDLLVTDIINARVQVLTSGGRPVATIGGYGLGPGQVYRPKGLAVDARGLVWVSDSVLGVVQVFTADGRFVDVLRDDQGMPLRLDTPMGMDFDGGGSLYVVELRPGRVRKLTLTEQPPAGSRPRLSATRSGKPQPRACTVCHLDWLGETNDGEQSLLSDAEVNRSAGPLAGREDMCLSCHDGSVADSRWRVWMAHGHRTGMAPSVGMTVPPNLPLVDGRIACRTCHTAHTTNQSTETDISRAVFLRMPNPSGQLCQACHGSMFTTKADYSHPMPQMPQSIPDILVKAGAHPGPDARQITCQTCHAAHGSNQSKLLVMGTDANQLCVVCHARQQIGNWRSGRSVPRPVADLKTTADQQQAMKAMGTQIGTGGSLICMSCHKAHHARSDRYVLAEPLSEGRMCLSCHPDYKGLVGSGHDLRTSCPQQRNLVGQNPMESGPCGTCHGFHIAVRQPAPEPVDPNGLCQTCHRNESQCGQKSAAWPFSHPQTMPADIPESLTSSGRETYGRLREGRLICLTCHNPHMTSAKPFLVAGRDFLCASCHARQASVLAGGHDFTAHPTARNGHGQPSGDTGKCGYCHAIHNAQGPVLWAATTDQPRTADDLCRTCHRIDGLAPRSKELVVAHPTDAAVAGRVRMTDDIWPRFGPDCKQDKSGKMACATCHDVHADSTKQPAMLRNIGLVSAGGSWCATCHPDARFIGASMHGPDSFMSNMGPNGNKSALFSCNPCHRVHPDQTPTHHAMWVAPLATDGIPEDRQRCLGCHGPGGSATQPTFIDHPQVPMRNAVAADDMTFMPLADDHGRLGSDGRITCQTCHLPHGRELPLPKGDPDSGMVGLAQRRGLKTLLRPYRVPNLCATCHGFQGLSLYLYYHYPEKRRLIDPFGEVVTVPTEK